MNKYSSPHPPSPITRFGDNRRNRPPSPQESANKRGRPSFPGRPLCVPSRRRRKHPTWTLNVRSWTLPKSAAHRSRRRPSTAASHLRGRCGCRHAIAARRRFPHREQRWVRRFASHAAPRSLAISICQKSFPDNPTNPVNPVSKVLRDPENSCGNRSSSKRAHYTDT